MPRSVRGCLALIAVAFVCVAATADPADLMPEPLEGWTARKVAVSESEIKGKGQKVMDQLGSMGAMSTGKAYEPPKRIVIKRDYIREQTGLRIMLNTRDTKGALLISYVNDVQEEDPEAAKELAAKGIRPFPFKSYQGVVMAAEGGNISGVALKLGLEGTLTLEGVLDGKPATAVLSDVQDYLAASDLRRMADFVKQANAPKYKELQEE